MMTIRKILIVPAEGITTASPRTARKAAGILKSSLKLDWSEVKRIAGDNLLCTEIQHYGDLPRLLGSENTFIVGEYEPEYRRPDLPTETRYPSLHNTPMGTHISTGKMEQIIPTIDAVLVSIRGGRAGEKAKEQARRHQKIIAVIDYFDHLDAYNNPDEDNLTHGLKKGDDFDVFFKHDLPLGCRKPYLLPLAPMPVRTENFPEMTRTMEKRDIPVFFSGQNRPGVLRDDREQIARLLEARLKEARMINPVQMRNLSLEAYWNLLSRTKIAYSPSGKVWDSTRHCEAAMFGAAVIIPKPDCETVHDLVRDGENCLAYETQRDQQGRYTAVDPERLIERVESVLDQPLELVRLAQNWKDEVLDYHTTMARAEYLIDIIGKIGYW